MGGWPQIELLGGTWIPALVAYLDPGAGSLVFQILIAGLVSGGVFLARGLATVKLWFSPGAAEPAKETKPETPSATRRAA